MNLQYVAVINDSQIVGCFPSEIYLQITWHYITQGALSSAVRDLSYYWEKEERKRLRSTI